MKDVMPMPTKVDYDEQRDGWVYWFTGWCVR